MGRSLLTMARCDFDIRVVRHTIVRHLSEVAWDNEYNISNVNIYANKESLSYFLKYAMNSSFIYKL